MNAPINRSWIGNTAINADSRPSRCVEELPQSMQVEHAALVTAVTEIENHSIPRPAGAPSFEALKRVNGYPGVGSYLRQTGLKSTELHVNGNTIDFDQIAGKIVSKSGELSNPQFLESYAELFLRLAEILRSNVDAVKADREQRTAYDIYRDELQTAQAQLQAFTARIAGMTEHEIETIRHAEELQQIRDEYEQRFKALEAAAGK